MNQLSLFDMNPGGNAGQNGTPGTASMTGGPLADRLRPAALEEYVGQRHLLGPGKILRQLLERDQIPSMIFWGLREWAKPLWPVSSPTAPAPTS